MLSTLKSRADDRHARSAGTASDPGSATASGQGEGAEMAVSGISARDFARIIDDIDVAVIRADLAGKVVDWNRRAEHVLGWTRREVLGRRAADVLAADQTASAWAEEPDPRRPDDRPVVMHHRSGSLVPVRHRVRKLRTENGLPAGEVSVILDATREAAASRRDAESRSFLAAVTDSMLEGLIVLDRQGRAILMNPAAEKLIGWRRSEIDELNLHQVIHSTRPDGSSHPSSKCPLAAAWRDGHALQVNDDRFLKRDGTGFPVTYTAAPLEGAEGCVVVFSDDSEPRAQTRLLRSQLADFRAKARVREALAGNRLRLYSQPIVRLDSGAVAQHELLLCVIEPDGTVTGPATFLADAERVGVANQLDRWAVHRGIQLTAVIRPVEINLSATSLGDRNLLRAIPAWIERYSVAPADITFEITETALLADEKAGQAFVAQLHQLGCGIALDDFGTGYGGFTYLKNLDVDILKIDIEFVADLRESDASRQVVAAMVHMARSFDLQTVAEGVEDEETLDLLASMGVDFAQGYLLGKPAPIPDRTDGGSAQAQPAEHLRRLK